MSPVAQQCKAHTVAYRVAKWLKLQHFFSLNKNIDINQHRNKGLLDNMTYHLYGYVMIIG